MAFTHGKKAKLYANGYDLSAFLKRISTASRVDVADVSALGATAKTYIPGLKDATLHAEGLFDHAIGTTADKIDDVLTAALGSDTAVSFIYLPTTDSQGANAYGFSAKETSYEVAAALGDAVTVTVDAQSDVARDALKTHHVLQTEAGTGNSTSIDNAASSANGGVGHLQVIGAGTIAAVTAKIQHSVDNSVWVDLITFTAFTARTHQRATVAGTVNRYTRGQWSAASTLPFWLGFGRT